MFDGWKSMRCQYRRSLVTLVCHGDQQQRSGGFRYRPAVVFGRYAELRRPDRPNRPGRGQHRKWDGFHILADEPGLQPGHYRADNGVVRRSRNPGAGRAVDGRDGRQGLRDNPNGYRGGQGAPSDRSERSRGDGYGAEGEGINRSARRLLDQVSPAWLHRARRCKRICTPTVPQTELTVIWGGSSRRFLRLLSWGES